MSAEHNLYCTGRHAVEDDVKVPVLQELAAVLTTGIPLSKRLVLWRVVSAIAELQGIMADTDHDHHHQLLHFSNILHGMLRSSASLCQLGILQ